MSVFLPGPPLGESYEIPIAPLSEVPFKVRDKAYTQRDLARRYHRKGLPWLKLSEFVSAAWSVLEPSTPLQWNWHLSVVCEHVEALLLDRAGPPRCRCDVGPKLCGCGPGIRGSGCTAPHVSNHEICARCGEGTVREPCPQNLLLNVPPGSMKSLIFSVFAPAWMWLHRPGWRAIYASGTPSVVTRDSLKTRTLVRSDWYRNTFKPDWDLSTDQDEKQNFANTKGGFRKAVSAGGIVTGERADFLGVDDPNDAREIWSQLHRRGINENWWDAAFHNRIADPTKSKRGLIMQRLHEEDLAGYVLEKEKGEWAHLSIPMEGDREGPGDRRTWIGWSDPRADGELMFPTRFTPKYLAGERLTLGSAGYAGQMQQRPVAAEGNRFLREWWRFWSADGKTAMRPKGCSGLAPVTFNPAKDLSECTVIGSWDCTYKDTDGTDYVVGLVVAVRGAQRFVLERYRKRAAFPETKRAVKQQADDWPRLAEILIEERANGPAVVADLATDVPGLVSVKPEGGNEARAAVMQPRVEAGNWLLPEGAPWLDEWVDEYGSFPRGKYDDQVDAGSQIEVRLLEDSDLANTRALLGL